MHGLFHRTVPGRRDDCLAERTTGRCIERDRGDHLQFEPGQQGSDLAVF